MTRIALFVVLLSACKVRNEQSCDIPGVCLDTDGGQGCTGDPDCTTGVCKLPEGRCVGCIDSEDCDIASTAPICNTATNTCEGCKVSADCASQACDVSTGACFTTDQVAYVEAGATGTTCDALSPCGNVQDALDTGRLVIKLLGIAPIAEPNTLAINRELVVLGDPGPMLPTIRTDNSRLFEVNNDASLTIRHVELSEIVGDAIEIRGAAASVILDHVFLLDNINRGVTASAGNLLVMRGCVVSGNEAGGLLLNDIDFEITNTLLVANGNSESTIGGMRSINPVPGNVVFEFNTIADNVSNNAASAGVACAFTKFAARNNIVAGIAGSASLDTFCTFEQSLFTGAMAAGVGNRLTSDTSAMIFLDVTPSHARETDFYRLRDPSPAIDQATVSTITTIDIDGEARPQGSSPDMGADEVTR